MNRTVRMGTAILAVSLAGASVATYFMAQRIRGFNEGLPDQFLFKAEDARDFVAFGHKVHVEDATIDDGAGRSSAAIRLDYGSSSVTVPVIAPKVKGYKDLSAYEESFRILSFAPIKAGKADIRPFSDENWRAVMIARETRPGFDQDTWGEVRVKDWTWLLYELKPDGTITPPRTIQFRDRKGRSPSEIYARDELKNAGKEAPPLPEQGGPRLTSVEPIDERSWEWQAALFTLPKMQLSRYRYRTDGVGSMGWTFGASGMSVLGIMLGSGLIMAGKVSKPRPVAPTTP